MKPRQLILSAFVLSFLSSVSAHSTVVYGTFMVTPQPPLEGQPFNIHITMRDPSDVPIEDAKVVVEARRDGDMGAAITANFKEVSPGDYETSLTLPVRGDWQIILRDQTFEYEETTATINLELGKTVSEAVNFEFPKTTAPRGFNLWLIAAIVAPILFGAVVTVRVLMGGKKAVPSEA
jgi:YtkA-like